MADQLEKRLTLLERHNHAKAYNQDKVCAEEGLMKRIKELFWRIDYMRHFRRQTGFPWRFCWSAACAAKAEYEESMGYTPAESVYEELSYWDGE